jgi:poly(A) polymerase
MIDFQDEYARHKDLWTHTVKVVAQVEASTVLRWAALLHDIGKVPTRAIDERGRVHFFGHEIAAARMFKQVSRRLGFPADQGSRIRFLIRNHLRAGQYEPDWTDSAVRRFGRETGDALEDLVKLSRADITTKYERKKSRNLMLLDELLGRVQGIREQDAVPPALPKGLGNVLMERYSLEPGRRLGRLMAGLKDVVEAGGLPRSAGHEVYLLYLDEHPDMLAGPK